MKCISAIFSFIALCICPALGQIEFVNSNSMLHDDDLHSAVPVAIADMNGDGLDDIMTLDNGRILYIQYQTPDPARPYVRYEVARNVDVAEQNDICIADYNNDGVNDILTIGSYDKVKVYYGIPHTYQYQLVTITVTPFFSQGASTGDFNHDGWVDVVMLNDNGANFTLMNDGTGNLVVQNYFNFITVPASDNSGNYGSVYTDFDMDGDLDFYIAKCRQGVNNPADPRRINVLHENDGLGNYTENAAKYGLAVGHQTWTADFGDVDNDGDMDCFMTQHDVVSELYENINNDTFVDITNVTGLNIGGIPLQGMFCDFDNDGFLDILVCGDRLDFYRSNGDKTFTKEEPFGPVIFGTYAIGDLNEDGFPDVYASRVIPFNNPDPLREDILFLNKPNGNHYLTLEVKQDGGNPSAIGTMALLYGPWGVQIREVRGGEQYGVSNSHKLMFGLGQATAYDSLVIRWPDGTREHFDQLEIDRHWNLKKGACVNKDIAVFDAFHVLCNNETLELELGDFSNQLVRWSTGDTSLAITVSQTGLYYGLIEDNDGCVLRTVPIEIATNPDTIQPVIFYEGHTSLCRGDAVELILPQALGYQWSSGETTQVVYPTTTGDYYALVQGYCTELSSDTIHLDFLTPEAPSIEPDTFLLGESATLFAPGDSIVWYSDDTGTTIIGTGNTIVLDDLTETTTVYAQNLGSMAGSAYQVGPVSHQGQNKYNATFVNGGLLFDVLEPLTLNQITLYTDTLGVRIIEITNASGFLFQKTVDLAAGATVVDLDVELAMGSYTITTNTASNMAVFGVNSPYLWRSSAGLIYPYEEPGVLSITNSTLGEDFYYYFYEWKFTTKERYCSSILVPGVAFLDSGVAVAPVDPVIRIQLDPNPTYGWVYMQTRDFHPSAVQVLGLDGRLILEKSLENDNTQALDLSALQSGMYLVRFLQPGKVFLGKVVKL